MLVPILPPTEQFLREEVIRAGMDLIYFANSRYLKGVSRVVDLGIAPGGWSQAVRRLAPKAAIVGIDLLPVDPIDGVIIFEMDFMDDAAPAKLIEALGGAPDLVMSDMAANTVGHPQTDALRTMALVEAARVAGVDKRARIELEDTTLHIKVEPSAPGAAPQVPQLGDAAIRSVVDILTGRQEPPRA